MCDKLSQIQNQNQKAKAFYNMAEYGNEIKDYFCWNCEMWCFELLRVMFSVFPSLQTVQDVSSLHFLELDLGLD